MRPFSIIHQAREETANRMCPDQTTTSSFQIWPCVKRRSRSAIKQDSKRLSPFTHLVDQGNFGGLERGTDPHLYLDMTVWFSLRNCKTVGAYDARLL